MIMMRSIKSISCWSIPKMTLLWQLGHIRVQFNFITIMMWRHIMKQPDVEGFVSSSYWKIPYSANCVQLQLKRLAPACRFNIFRSLSTALLHNLRLFFFLYTTGWIYTLQPVSSLMKQNAAVHQGARGIIRLKQTESWSGACCFRVGRLFDR